MDNITKYFYLLYSIILFVDNWGLEWCSKKGLNILLNPFQLMHSTALLFNSKNHFLESFSVKGYEGIKIGALSVESFV